MKTLFGLYGAGGFGREVMPIVHQSISASCFVETSPLQGTLGGLNGTALISEDDFFRTMGYDEKYFNVAIANSKARQEIAERCISRGAISKSLFDKTSRCLDDVGLGEGTILCANTVITSNVRIGKFFHLNLNSYVGHDCRIGDYVTFSPNVGCNGGVRIGNHVFIGSGALIRPGVTIGDNVLIGMGAVVVRDVPEGKTVVGNPAQIMSRKK